MKLPRHFQCRSGCAVVVMLVIIAILGIFVVANAKRLHQLNQELKIVERRQVERFRAAPPAASATNVPTLRESH